MIAMAEPISLWRATWISGVARCPGQERDSDVLQNLHAMNGKDTQVRKN
jgi:hypothetical protein